MPFSTALMAEFITYRAALVEYWRTCCCSASSCSGAGATPRGHGLLKDDVPALAGRSIERRIVIAQALYGFGALLCLVNTYVSIGFIVLVAAQLRHRAAPGAACPAVGTRLRAGAL